MAKNYYFENYNNSMEQTLIEDLVIESIKIYGVDCYYIPRKKVETLQNKYAAEASFFPATVDILIDDPSGSIFSVDVNYGGKEYPAEPIVTVTGDGQDASVTATIIRGVVTKLTVENAGTGYVNATTTISIESPTEVSQRLGLPVDVAGGYDDLLNEDDLPGFKEAFEVEMYIKNVDGFEGEGDFLSKFGLQIRDSMTLTVANRVWEQEVGSRINAIVPPGRPFEGDLIYFPLNNKMFEIMHVEHEAIFYQMGSLQTYDLRCELFEYSNEIFNTGIPAIDNLWADRYTAATSSNDPLIANTATIEEVDNFADNWTIEKEGDNILDFSADNPFGESNY